MGVNGHWYVELEKQAFWRGAPHTWVNRYVMSGAQPSASDAQSVITALHLIENDLHPPMAAGVGVGYVQGRAYPSGKGTFFANVDYNVSKASGTATGFHGPPDSGDLVWAPTLETCLLIETRLQGLSSTGKPTYLRKYFRGCSTGAAQDNVAGGIPAGTITDLNALTTPWQTGMGSQNWVVIGNSGSQASAAPTVHPFLVAHQVPRGKKKKPSSASGLIAQIAADAAKVRSLASAASDFDL